MDKHPIGIFDSGFGGLTILKEIHSKLPQYDYIYMGDSARAPYGPLPFSTVYQYTLQAVKWFLSQGCNLVVLACNTASAKALRSIQQNDLPALGNNKRVLGVIRPTAEVMGNFTQSNHIGVLGTQGTVNSASYVLEIKKFFPSIEVSQEACPSWVEIIENGKFNSPAVDPLVHQHISNILQQDYRIDALLLACTHYPLLLEKISEFVPRGIKIISQGVLVAESLAKYLAHHPEMDDQCSKGGSLSFYTTGPTLNFDNHSSNFFGKPVKSLHLEL